MKKLIAVLLLCVITVFSFVSCESGITVSQNGNSDIDYEMLETLLERRYREINLEIKVESNGAELLSVYTLQDDEITYSVELINDFDINASEFPESYKTAYTGVTKNAGEKITIDTPDGRKKIKIPSYEELRGSFNFDDDFFEDPRFEDNKFKAKVKKPKDFAGYQIDVQDITDVNVNIVCGEDAIESIVLTYMRGTTAVTTTYTFYV